MPQDVAVLGQSSLLKGRLLLPIIDRAADMPVMPHVVGRIDPNYLFRHHGPNRPEVGGEVGVGEVVVGDPAIATYSPLGGPGVADEELVGLVIVPDGHEGMSTEVGFVGLGHGDKSASSGDGGLEALVDGEAEDEGYAGS